jgi:hypothetical protein
MDGDVCGGGRSTAMRSEGPRRMRPGLPRRGGGGAGEYFILLLGLGAACRYRRCL